MKKFKIDFIEFVFLVEACIPPRPIARTMFWHEVIDDYYYQMTSQERDRLYEWINKNDYYREAVKKEHDAYLFELRFNPDNQYEVETEYEGEKKKHQCFKVNDRYYTKRNSFIVEEYITDVKKL